MSDENRNSRRAPLSFEVAYFVAALLMALSFYVGIDKRGRLEKLVGIGDEIPGYIAWPAMAFFLLVLFYLLNQAASANWRSFFPGVNFWVRRRNRK